MSADGFLQSAVTDDAEYNILCGLISDNSLIEFCAGLEPEHFSDAGLGLLFGEVANRINAGNVASPSTLQTWAKANEVPFEVLVNMHAAGGVRAKRAESLTKAIRDAAAHRALVGLLASASSALRAEPSGSAYEAAGDIMRDLEKIAAGGAGQSITASEAGYRALKQFGQRGLMTGYANLDRRLNGLHAGNLIVLGGRPGMGKSSLAANIAHSVAHRGMVVHFASLEMSAEEIALRALSRLSINTNAATPYTDLRNGSHGVDIGAFDTLPRALPITWEIDDRGGQTLAYLEGACRATKAKHRKLDLVVVDYLQLMGGKSDRSILETVTVISQGLKSLAKRLRCPIIALSQLSRKVEERNDKRPILSDLRESGAIEQDADVVMFTYREAYYLEKEGPSRKEGERFDDYNGRVMLHEQRVAESENKLELIVAKNRHGRCGAEELRCDLAFDVIEEVS